MSEPVVAPWELDDGRIIHLLTPADFAALPDGTILTCIDGTQAEKGKDVIDGDTRYGRLAFGLPVALPEQEATK